MFPVAWFICIFGWRDITAYCMKTGMKTLYSNVLFAYSWFVSIGECHSLALWPSEPCEVGLPPLTFSITVSSHTCRHCISCAAYCYDNDTAVHVLLGTERERGLKQTWLPAFSVKHLNTQKVLKTNKKLRYFMAQYKTLCTFPRNLSFKQKT